MLRPEDRPLPPPEHEHRREIHQHALAEGAAWEASTRQLLDAWVAATLTKPKFAQARLGANAEWYKGVLSEALELGDFQVLGHGRCEVQEVRILNRILKLHSDKLTLEADPRHGELLARYLNVGNARSHRNKQRHDEFNNDEVSYDPDHITNDHDNNEDSNSNTQHSNAANTIPATLAYSKRQKARITERKVDGVTMRTLQRVRANEDIQ